MILGALLTGLSNFQDQKGNRNAAKKAAGPNFSSQKASGWMQAVFFLVLRIGVNWAVKKIMPYHFNLLHHGRVNTELSKIHEDLEKSLLMKK